MAGERRQRILATLLEDGRRTSSSARLCQVSAEVAGVTGSGIMLMSGDVPRGSLCTTDAVSELIEDLQYSLGEGPCIDAYKGDRVVREPDLANAVTPRWPAFTPPVVEAGARAVFAFPLRTGTVRMGALNLYRDQPGSMTDDQHADALAIADVVADWVLDRQAGAGPGSVAKELAADADFHFVVHNAAGMVSVQLGVSIAEALIRLRGHAFAHDRPLGDVAADVIAHRLRFEGADS